MIYDFLHKKLAKNLHFENPMSATLALLGKINYSRRRPRWPSNIISVRFQLLIILETWFFALDVYMNMAAILYLGCSEISSMESPTPITLCLDLNTISPGLLEAESFWNMVEIIFLQPFWTPSWIINFAQGVKVALIGLSKYSLLANFLCKKIRNHTSCYTYPGYLLD